MDLTEQKYIVTIAQCRGISVAAEKLHISQPALSKYLTNLEKRIGVKLFERSNKTFRVTQEGELYLQIAHQILMLGEEFNHKLNQMLSNPAPIHLNIGLQIVRAAYTVPLLIKYFQQQMPNVTLTFTQGYREELLELYNNKELDLILLIDIDLPKDLARIVLRNEHVVLVARAGDESLPYVWDEVNNMRVVDLEEIRNRDFYSTGPNTSSGILIRELLKECEVDLPKYKYGISMNSILNMTSLGMGYSLTVDSYLAYPVLMSPVQCYMVKQFTKPVNYVAVYDSERFSTTLIKKITNVLKMVINEEKESGRMVMNAL